MYRDPLAGPIKHL